MSYNRSIRSNSSDVYNLSNKSESDECSISIGSFKNNKKVDRMRVYTKCNKYVDIYQNTDIDRKSDDDNNFDILSDSFTTNEHKYDDSIEHDNLSIGYDNSDTDLNNSNSSYKYDESHKCNRFNIDFSNDDNENIATNISDDNSNISDNNSNISDDNSNISVNISKDSQNSIINNNSLNQHRESSCNSLNENELIEYFKLSIPENRNADSDLDQNKCDVNGLDQFLYFLNIDNTSCKKCNSNNILVFNNICTKCRSILKHSEMFRQILITIFETVLKKRKQCLKVLKKVYKSNIDYGKYSIDNSIQESIVINIKRGILLYTLDRLMMLAKSRILNADIQHEIDSIHRFLYNISVIAWISIEDDEINPEYLNRCCSYEFLKIGIEDNSCYVRFIFKSIDEDEHIVSFTNNKTSDPSDIGETVNCQLVKRPAETVDTVSYQSIIDDSMGLSSIDTIDNVNNIDESIIMMSVEQTKNNIIVSVLEYCLKINQQIIDTINNFL